MSQDHPPQGEGGGKERQTHSHSPSLAPSSNPSLQQHAPATQCPQGRQNGEGGEETGQGERDEPRRVTGQGRTRSPKTVWSAKEQGKEKWERIIVVVRSPCQENYPADAHPSRQTQHGLGVCIWMHLVNGTDNSPSLGQPNPGVVKQDKSSRGSVDTTKTRSGPQRVRMSSGERPIGAAKGKQSDTEALWQTPRRRRYMGLKYCVWNQQVPTRGAGQGGGGGANQATAHSNHGRGAPRGTLLGLSADAGLYRQRDSGLPHAATCCQCEAALGLS